MNLIFIIFFFLGGICLGSFLNAIVYRLPREIKIYSPFFSFCPECKKTLSFWQNIPVFSWLFLKGRCYYCSCCISARYFWVEFLLGVLFVLIGILYPNDFYYYFFLFFILAGISLIDMDFYLISLPLLFVACFALLLGDIWGVFQGIAPVRIFNFAFGFLFLKLIIYLGTFLFGKKFFAEKNSFSWKFLKKEKGKFLSISFNGQQETILLPKVDSGANIEIDLQETNWQGEIFTGNLRIFQDFLLYEGKKRSFENFPQEGKAKQGKLNRSVLGDGDPYVLALITGFLGWESLFFVLLSSSIYGIFWAIFKNKKRGDYLPYAPFLSLGALTWVLGGNQVWQIYLKALSLF